MPQDVDLYGIRKPKNTKKEISSSTTLAFTSQLSSLLAASTSASSERSSSGRPRPGPKSDIFTAHNKNSKKRSLKDREDAQDDFRSRVGKQDIGGVDEATLHRSKRKMEEKARLYSAMKRGDYVPGEHEPESLIDFDRKWAEEKSKGGALSDLDTSSDDGQDSDDARANEMVEYIDQFGRTRQGTRAEAEREERRQKKQLLGAEELDRMSARPAMPSELIYGDTVQSMAFNPDEPVTAKMAELAAKRDRSPTPPEAKHYEADKEVRTKGVGFYAFSKDEALRQQEMEALERERAETEKIRVEREERKAKRKEEVEKRRREIEAKRAKKQADSFLDTLGTSLAKSSSDVT
jgi:hypothetical protein